MYRILFIAPTPPRFTGPEIATKQLLESGLTRRFEIIHIKSNVRISDDKDSGIIDILVVWKFLKILWEIFWKTLTLSPQLVYCIIGSNKTGFLRDVCVVTLANFMGKKVVAHYHGGNFDNFYKFSSSFMKKIIQFGLSQIDIIIVLGYKLVNMFEDLYPREKIRVLYNGINLTEVNKRIKLNHNSKLIKILYMGRITFAKGFCDLILAYQKVRKKHPNVQLNFAGKRILLENERNIIPVYFSDELKKRFLNSNDLIDNFMKRTKFFNADYLGIITGKFKNKVLQDADIFIQPSYSEGFSFAVLEAMASGLPVITTNVGAMSEIVSDGENGFLIEPGDYEMLYKKISQLIEDENLRRDMAKRSIEKVENKFNIERIAKKLGDIFIEVLLNWEIKK